MEAPTYTISTFAELCALVTAENVERLIPDMVNYLRLCALSKTHGIPISGATWTWIDDGKTDVYLAGTATD